MSSTGGSAGVYPPGGSPGRWWPVAALVGLGAGVAAAVLLQWAQLSGRFILQEDLARDYTAGVLWALVLGATIPLWPVPPGHRRALVRLWGAKVAMALGFMLFFEYQYDLDAYGWFQVARQPNIPAERAIFGGGSDLVALLAWMQNQLLADSYHALKISFAMVGLVAVYVLYRAATLFLERDEPRFLYALALCPSVLFWSTIFGKDPVVLLGIALYVYGVVGWTRLHGLRHLFILCAGVVLAMSIRLWLAPILLLPMAILVLRVIRGVVARVLFLGGVGAALVYAVGQVAALFAIESTQDAINTTSAVSQAWATGGSAQQIGMDLTSLPGLLAFAPLGAFTALFRPLPGEIMNPFGLLAGVENAVLVGLLLRALVRVRWRTIRDPLVSWAILLVLVWSVAYGFVSYQNLGAAVRFRLQILPVLLGLLLYLGRRRDATPPDPHPTGA